MFALNVRMNERMETIGKTRAGQRERQKWTEKERIVEKALGLPVATEFASHVAAVSFRVVSSVVVAGAEIQNLLN